MSKFLFFILLSCFSLFLNGAPLKVDIHLSNANPQKDLTKCYVGYDAEDFACGFNFKWMLTAGRNEFKEYCYRAGVRCLRFAEMSRYSWRSELATRKMIAATYAVKYAHAPKISQNTLKKKLDWWFSPELFWSFCRENRIVVLPMFNAETFYNHKDQKAYYFVNKPEYYQAAANESAAYVKYLKKKSYLDMAKVWEIGNECYLKKWKPAEYAAFVKILIKTVRKIQPDIKLAIPTFICSRDNPDVHAIMKRIKSASPNGKKTEWQIYDEAMKWTAATIKALGKDAQYISYGVKHSYGAGPLYNTNYKGIDSSHTLLQAIPESKNWRMVNTEWRDRSGENLWCHRAFWNSALWKSKFTLLLMAYPKMDYTAAHSLFAFSGGLYWSNGNKWVLQFNPDRSLVYDKNTPGSKPRFDIGAYGPVVKMCNDLIDTHPNLIAYKAGLGKMSSAKYYQSFRAHRKDPETVINSDIEYLAAVNSTYDSIALLIVNTHKENVKINLTTAFGKTDIGSAEIELLSCDPQLLDQLQIPGSGFYPWKLSYYGQNTQKYLTVPANSFMKVTVPLTFTGKKLPEGANLIPAVSGKRVPPGFRGISGAKLSRASSASIKITNPTKAKTIYLQVPTGKIGVSDTDRKFKFGLKFKSSKPLTCSALIAGKGWSRLGGKAFKSDKIWQSVKVDFTLKAKEKIKIIRINIYNCPADGALLTKDFILKQINN